MNRTTQTGLRPQAGNPNTERWKGPETAPGPDRIKIEHSLPQGVLPGASGTYSPRPDGEDPQPFVIRQ